MKIYCNDCEGIHDTVIYREHTGVVSPDGVWETHGHEVCENCYSEDIEEVTVCDLCGEWFVEEEIGEWHGHYCPTCVEMATEKLDEAVWKVRDDLQADIDTVQDLFAGIAVNLW